MDLREISELVMNLNTKLPTWASDNKLKEFLSAYYEGKNISASNGLKLLNKRASIETLDTITLCIFVNSIYGYNKDSKIDPKKYFDEGILELEKLYKKANMEDNRVHVFQNVDEITKNHWMSTKTDYKEIAHLSNIGFTGYNYKTQRQATIILRGKDIVRIPTLNKKNLVEILEKMKTGKFTSNTISLNYQHESIESMVYDAVARTLTVTLADNDVLYILDGFHRLLQMCALIEESPNFPGTTSVNIFNYTEEQANEFIRQEASGQGIPESHLEKLSEKSLSTTIAKDINEVSSKDNFLFNMITSDIREVKLDLKYTTLDTMSMAIRECFGITNETDDRMMLREVKDVLLRGLNEIIGLEKKHFNNLKLDRLTSIISFSGSFMLYVAIIARLYKLGYADEETIADRHKFENKLAEVIKLINSSITLPLWKTLGIVTPKNSMTSKMSILDCDRIQKYVEEKLVVVETKLEEVSSDETDKEAN